MNDFKVGELTQAVKANHHLTEKIWNKVEKMDEKLGDQKETQAIHGNKIKLHGDIIWTTCLGVVGTAGYAFKKWLWG